MQIKLNKLQVTASVGDELNVSVKTGGKVGVNIYLGYSTVANSYNTLADKPKINDVELVGNKTLVQLGIEPKRGVDDFYVTGAEKTQGALATGNTILPTVKDVADNYVVDYNYNSSDDSDIVYNDITNYFYNKHGFTLIKNFDYYKISIDFNELLPEYSTGIYYVSPTGNDTTGTGTILLPFKSIGKALSMSGVNEIRLFGGIYTRGLSVMLNPTRDVKIVGFQTKKPILTTCDTFTTWTNMPSTNVYTVTRSSTYMVIDNDILENGSGKILTKVTTYNDCVNTPYSWYLDGLNLLHINLDGKVPNLNTLVAVISYMLNQTSNNNIYFYNVEFSYQYYGVLKANSNAIQKIFMAKNCVFNRCYTGNLLSIRGNVLSIIVDTKFENGAADNLNYHGDGTYSPDFVEVGVMSQYAGNYLVSNSNASTSHEDCKGIRVNGFYGKVWGPVIADVNNALTFNANLITSASLYPNNYKSDYYFDQPSYIVKCKSNSVNVVQSAVGVMPIIFKCDFKNNIN